MRRQGGGETAGCAPRYPSRAPKQHTLRRQHGAWVGTAKRGPMRPALAWVPPSLAEGFMGSRAALPEDHQEISNIHADLFHPRTGNANAHSERQRAQPGLLVRHQGEGASMRCARHPQHGEFPMSDKVLISSPVPHSGSLFGFQTASTRADCEAHALHRPQANAGTKPHFCNANSRSRP